MKENEIYFDSHPELKSLINDFLMSTLLRKPEDIKVFAKTFFSDYLKPQPPVVICSHFPYESELVLSLLLNDFSEVFTCCIEHTSRVPNPNEVDGKDFYFLEESKMREEVENGNFITYREVNGTLYGISLKTYLEVLETGKICILNVNTESCAQIQHCEKMEQIPFYLYLSVPNSKIEEKIISQYGPEKLESKLKEIEEEKNYFSKKGDFRIDVNEDSVKQDLDKIETRLFEWYPHLYATRKEVQY